MNITTSLGQAILHILQSDEVVILVHLIFILGDLCLLNLLRNCRRGTGLFKLKLSLVNNSIGTSAEVLLLTAIAAFVKAELLLVDSLYVCSDAVITDIECRHI